MKTFEKQAAQGDLIITRIAALPKDVVPSKAEKGVHVASHSETGHAHVIKQCEDVEFFHAANDNMKAYLVVHNDGPVIEHLRGHDIHESIMFKQGIYEITRQREYSPEGWRVALD